MSFSIDTDKVISVADNISSLASQVNSLASSVGGYDTANEDGFDFAGAKSAIDNNIKGMSTKFENTVALLTAVTGAHAALQESIDTGNDGAGDSSTNTGNNQYYGGGSSGSGRRSGGGGSSHSGLASSIGNFAAGAAGAGVLAASGYLAGTDYDGDMGDGESTIDVASSRLASANLLEDNNLSARELLEAELGTSSAEATSILNQNLEVTLSSNNIQTIEADDLAVISRDNAVLIVEGHSNDPEINTYLKRVAKVAASYTIEVKFLKLDDIVERKQEEEITSTSIDLSTSSNKTSTISLTEPISSSKITSVVENTDKTLKIADNNGEGKDDLIVEPGSKDVTELDGIKAIDEEKEVDPNTPGITSDTIGETTSVLETQSIGSSETGTIKNEPVKILNKEEYEKLTKIGTSSKKNDILNGPVTLILKNKAIISSMNGYLTEMTIRSMLQLAGIKAKTTSV